MTMGYAARRELFCEHATAMFRGDRAECGRTERLIYPRHCAAHQLFIQSLFAACVFEHFGKTLDWTELDRFAARLRVERPGVSPLKTEALVRAFYGETRLYGEIPQIDHWPCMWSVAQMVVGVDRSDAELRELYERAETVGRETVKAVFVSSGLLCYRDEETLRL